MRGLHKLGIRRQRVALVTLGAIIIIHAEHLTDIGQFQSIAKVFTPPFLPSIVLPVLISRPYSPQELVTGQRLIIVMADIQTIAALLDQSLHPASSKQGAWFACVCEKCTRISVLALLDCAGGFTDLPHRLPTNSRE